MEELLTLDPEQPIVISSSSVLENAFRKVISELLDAKEQEMIEKRLAMLDQLISRKDAAERLDKDPITLYRWEKCGMLHPQKKGRSVFYPMAEIIALEGEEL